MSDKGANIASVALRAAAAAAPVLLNWAVLPAAMVAASVHLASEESGLHDWGKILSELLVHGLWDKIRSNWETARTGDAEHNEDLELATAAAIASALEDIRKEIPDEFSKGPSQNKWFR